MRVPSIIVCLSIFTVICAEAQNNRATASPQKKRVVIAVKMLFDGRGKVLRDTRIVVEGSKIVALDPKAMSVDYDLRDFTVMPGWIDSHVHITWSFGEDGKNAGADETTQFAAYQAESNAWRTLMAGFTTVQERRLAHKCPAARRCRKRRDSRSAHSHRRRAARGAWRKDRHARRDSRVCAQAESCGRRSD